MATPAESFYCTAACCMAGVWAVFSLGGGEDFYRRGLKCPVATRPTWLPGGFLALLLRPTPYLTLCHGTPVVLGIVGMWGHDMWGCRIFASVVLSLYALAESAVTNSHRDYTLVYCSWALVIFHGRDHLARGFALGVCVYFMSASGLGKLHIAGAGAWAHSSTLTGVLQLYGTYSLGEGGPASRALNEMVASSPLLVSGLSSSTLIFECILVPASLAIRPEQRPIIAAMAFGLHVGIAMVQSFGIGLAFIPNTASYVLGFGGILSSTSMSGPGVAVNEPGWWMAVAVAVCSSIRPLLFNRLLPESWPLSSFALFPWSGPQWAFLFAHFVNNETRLVIAPWGTAPKDLLGKSLVPKYTVDEERRKVDLGVFDGWEQCLGETIVHPTVLDATMRLFKAHVGSRGLTKSSWDEFTAAIQSWLCSEKRLVRVNGQLLASCFVVTIDRSQQDSSSYPVIKSVISTGGQLKSNSGL